MVRKKIVIDNPTGLHLRPAGTFCKAANSVREQNHSSENYKK